MRTLIIALVAVFCISCDEILVPSESPNTESLTTYQFSNSLKLYPSVEFMDGSLWEVMIYYYVGKEIIKTDSINPVLTGQLSEKFQIPANIEKIKFSFQLAPKKSQYYNGIANCRRYSVNFILLEKGKNNIIAISDLSSICLKL